MELKILKCEKCGAYVLPIKDCTCDDCGIMCCSEKMKAVEANSVEASFEKHMPTFTLKGKDIEVRVNHVMEEDHYIEWIAQVTDNNMLNIVHFKPNEEAVAVFNNEHDAMFYAYCNKHGLWSNYIEIL